MKKLILLAVVFTGIQSFALTDSEKEQLKSDFAAADQTVIVNDFLGRYTGSCTSHWNENQKEALYIQSFENLAGAIQVIPMTTSQFYDDSTIPKKLEYLTTGSSKNLNNIAEFIRMGYSGTDNNVGNIGQGGDFAYVYSLQVPADHKSFSMVVSYQKTSDDNTAPVLKGCQYGLSKDGRYVYQNCQQRNDQTVFKKNAKGQLISQRTADERIRGTNLLSFSLPEISDFCVWTKVK